MKSWMKRLNVGGQRAREGSVSHQAWTEMETAPSWGWRRSSAGCIRRDLSNTPAAMKTLRWGLCTFKDKYLKSPHSTRVDTSFPYAFIPKLQGLEVLTHQEQHLRYSRFNPCNFFCNNPTNVSLSQLSNLRGDVPLPCRCRSCWRLVAAVLLPGSEVRGTVQPRAGHWPQAKRVL